MAQTILEIVNSARVGTALPRATSLFAADARRTKTVELAEKAVFETLDDFLKRPWTALETAASIVSVAGQENYPLPADYHRMLTDTFWSNRVPGIGPISAAGWRYFQNWNLGGNMFPRWRIKGSNLQIHPIPAASGVTYTFDYISKNLAYGTGGYVWGSFVWGQGFWNATAGASGYKERFTTNADTFRLDESVLRHGLHWRMLKDTGMPYAVEERTYRDEMDQLFAVDGGGPGTIDIGRRTTGVPPIFTTIGGDPDSSYPVGDAGI